MLTTNVLLYLAVNLAGMYTKYLTDRGQRQAFLEIHRSTETRQHTQNENNRQEKLLLSGEEIQFSLKGRRICSIKISWNEN
jgi:adenylate cyclase 8